MGSGCSKLFKSDQDDDNVIEPVRNNEHTMHSVIIVNQTAHDKFC